MITLPLLAVLFFTFAFFDASAFLKSALKAKLDGRITEWESFRWSFIPGSGFVLLRRFRTNPKKP